MARVAVRGLGRRPAVTAGAALEAPVEPVEPGTLVSPAFVRVQPDPAVEQRLLEIVSAPLDDDLGEFFTPLVEVAAAPIDPALAEAFDLVRDVHERTVAAKADPNLTAAARRGIDETHARTLDGVESVMSRVASAAQGSRAGEANEVLVAAAVDTMRELARAAARDLPAPHVEVSMPAPHVEVHTPEMRPEFHVQAAPSPDVHVDVAVPAQTPPVVHVAPAEVRVEVAPAPAPVFQIPPTHVEVIVPEPRPFIARPVRDERGEIDHVVHEYAEGDDLVPSG